MNWVQRCSDCSDVFTLLRKQVESDVREMNRLTKPDTEVEVVVVNEGAFHVKEIGPVSAYRIFFAREAHSILIRDDQHKYRVTWKWDRTTPKLDLFFDNLPVEELWRITYMVLQPRFFPFLVV